MNIDDIELKLLAGMAIEIEDCGHLHVPTVREVVTIGESKYNQQLSTLLLDKSAVNGEIDENTSNFDIVFVNCYHNEDFKSMFLSGIEQIFKMKAQMCDVSTSTEAFFCFDNGGTIHKDNFDLIQTIVRIGNHVKFEKNEDEVYNPADEVTAKIIAEMLERRKKKPKPKPIMNLHSMISGMAWKTGSSQISNILDLTMYQFYDGYKRIEKLDSIYYTLFGIYTGNVDAKNINAKDLNFAKILK